MLEIKDVHKTYKPKKGVPVKALDGVSLSFDDKGLVFILGKSGSGKSTLLNVIGGLDSADSGEFSIKGKSSKNFSQADFDSYRNTFIGFIFQEYNILNEFTVGQNIALAMKLQGKKVDESTLNKILEEVDLEGFGNRKPNELSGGQKQRVAIARALIKEPEIIMADEPTGALDSNTGKQVFDTLKKLSKDKLVIVVSHDRDFAEYYGDRVIELADGKIISDITKETAISQKESEGLSIVDDKILHIRKGYKLTAKDMKKIQSYIDSADSDTIISLDGRANESFCQIARIDKDGNQEVFKDTDNELLSKNNQNYDGSSKFIRSKLPLSHAFKIGANSLRTKPLRLFITIFLCLVSFAMFGLADTIGAYNAKKTTANSIMDSNYDSIVIGAKVKTDDGYYASMGGASQNDFEKVKEASGVDFAGVAYADDRISVYEPNKLKGNNYSQYYREEIAGYLPASQEDFEKYGFGQLIGRLPINDDEIVITQYIYDQFSIAGLVYSEGNEQKVIKAGDFNSPQELLEMNVVIQAIGNGHKDKNWKLVGVIDTKADADGRYKDLKPAESASNDSIMNWLMQSECQKYFHYGFHGLGFISQNAYQAIIDGYTLANENAIGTPVAGYFGANVNANSYLSIDFSYIADTNYLDKAEILWLDGKSHTSLGDNEFIISLNGVARSSMFDFNGNDKVDLENININFKKSYFGGLVEVEFSNLYDLIWWNREAEYIASYEEASSFSASDMEKFRSYVISIGDKYGSSAMSHFISNLFFWFTSDNFTFNVQDFNFNINEMSADELAFLYAGYLRENGIYLYDYINDTQILLDGGGKVNALGWENGQVAIDYRAKKLYFSLLFDAVDYTIDITNTYFSLNNSGGSLYYNLDGGKIVGFALLKNEVNEDGYFSQNDPNGVIFNNAMFEAVKPIEPSVYSFFIAPMPSRSQLEKLIDLHYDKSVSRGLSIENGVTYMLDMVGDMLDIMGMVFLYVGIGLAVFSMLLMSNYIAISISYKKREIGILRAVGAKSSDVFAIFFSESLLIALINFVLSGIVCFAGCTILNTVLRNNYGLQITLLSFGIRQIGLMLLISVAVALVASFIPVFRLSRKKPIDTIRTA